MNSLLILVGLLAGTSFASAFNATQFFNKYCYTTTYNNVSTVSCTQFMLSQTDVAAFQNETFVISNATNILLAGCTIGTFNENFVNKFPNATSIEIQYCSLNLNNVHSNISKVNTVLKTLTIQSSEIYESVGSITGFSQLTGLTSLSIRGFYLQNHGIDSTIFANNTNLVYLEISNVQLSQIDANAFVNLANLKTINITGTGLSVLPYGLLTNNKKLQTVALSNNKIEYLPLPFFPTSVMNIQLSKNILEVISAPTLKGLSNLSYLDLSQNSISVFSNAALSSAQNLGYLDLHNNQITKFERKLFSQCKNLMAVYLYNNKFTTLPEDIFDDLSKLGIVVVNPINSYFGL